MYGYAESDENFRHRFSKNRTELNRPQNSKTKTRFPRRFGDSFSRCLIHNSSCSMIGSIVKVFFFMPYLCTSCSESLQLTISWTSSSWEYVISSVIYIKQHIAQKNEPKTTVFCKTEPKTKQKSFFANRTPLTGWVADYK